MKIRQRQVSVRSRIMMRWVKCKDQWRRKWHKSGKIFEKNYLVSFQTVREKMQEKLNQVMTQRKGHAESVQNGPSAKKNQTSIEKTLTSVPSWTKPRMMNLLKHFRRNSVPRTSFSKVFKNLPVSTRMILLNLTMSISPTLLQHKR